MLLSELIKDLIVLDVKGDCSIEIRGISYDSRKTGEGHLFVCIDGLTTDGHDFAYEALRSGAAAYIAQRDLQLPEGCPVIRTSDNRIALAHISDRFYGHPSSRLNLIGITGTKGKTTTSFMVKSILEAAGRKVGIIGTLGARIGERVMHSERTTPESLELQELLSLMADEGVDDVVMEVSSQGLALHRVDSCEFDIGVFTNLSRDHIGEKEHASLEDYLKSKCLLFKMCKSGLVNLDSQYAKAVMEGADCEIYTFGLEGGAGIKAENILKMPGSVSFDINSPWYNGRLFVNIPGRFTVYNALAAAGIGGMLSVSAEAVKDGLNKVQVPGRAETVDTERDFSVIIDYAHTPDSLENILSTVREYTAGKLICVFGCGGDRDRSKRPMMGAISGELADYTVITSDNPRSEEPGAIIKDVEAGIRSTTGRYKCITDRRKAIEHALLEAQKGDVIVLAGKGHETYQEFKHKTIHFDEREVVLELLQKM